MSLMEQYGNDGVITQEEMERRWNDSDLARYTRKFSLYDWMLNQGSEELVLIFVTRKQVLILSGPKHYIDNYGQEEGLEHLKLGEIAAKITNMEATYPVIKIACSNYKRPRFCCPLAFEDTKGCTEQMKEIVRELSKQAGHVNAEEKRRGYLGYQCIEPIEKPNRVSTRKLEKTRSEDDSNEKICGVPLNEFLEILRKQNLELAKGENNTAKEDRRHRFLGGKRILWKNYTKNKIGQRLIKPFVRFIVCER